MTSASDSPLVPGNGVASCGGHGTDEVLEVTQLLENHRITCCIGGASALIFYGAERVRHTWEIIVDSGQLGDAIELLKSPKYASDYLTLPAPPFQQRFSLPHTYQRFRGSSSNYDFTLVPSDHSHFSCHKSTICRSVHGLPYPKLPVLIQSFLDTNNRVALCDVVDGTNVSEDWGLQHLDLSGTNDVEWALRLNKMSTHPVPPFPTAAIKKLELWKSVVQTKIDRLGWTRPSELFTTQYRLKGSEDPWLVYSKAY
ncbi:hypothetical protein P152DRAFT_433382 [Eremomyces bilateralis CBS 781.70]|uniref:Uncharacterized protein n=1 Tax=Eremomyces bilateralis CBS 781.70 TaxID=1392243 RepID=A0A6G1G7H5_9PEZI|nr:uncharacterized protein P152DRAFT_433382 [Eremomyces bilateralis CBS 781.70]KAF1813840.1 hypothetical protein P152DRAFT_433382 [Eremomyces bilateralis CBS 781.70]